jgi:DEAD/DEAH box helicase domain-containing protein
MLEYMLVRNVDRPIIDQSKGKFRWIVIDEAHTYLGSQAAELALLLRRVLHAFGCSPDQVHFIATSATIAGDSNHTEDKLRDFLAKIAGTPANQVSLLLGERMVPPLPALEKTNSKQIHDIEALNMVSSEESFEDLVANPKIRKIRAMLARQAAPLSSISSLLYEKVGIEEREIGAVVTSSRGADGEPVSSIHLYDTAQGGAGYVSQAAKWLPELFRRAKTVVDCPANVTPHARAAY